MNESRIRHLPEELVPGHFEEMGEVANRMSAAIEAGLKFAVGTDGVHGGLAQEASYLVELGATNLKALQAATINGAIACGIDDEVGSIEVGKSADLVALSGNPFDEIGALSEVVAVMKQGGLVFNQIGTKQSV